MAVNLRFVVEDVATQLLTYDRINVYRAPTLTGTYSSIGTVALVAGTFYYSFSDSGGDLNKWYKYSFRLGAGPPESDLSAPFRVDGVTRLRARQAALAKYGAGIVVVNTGTAAGNIVTSDYRVKTSLFRADRGKGTWLLPTTGTNQGAPRIVSATDPSTGTMTVLPAWGAAMANGDEVEWHWLADPTVWDDALNRAMPRYWYVERVPIVGVAGKEEYDLSVLPFLRDHEQVHDVRWYPTSGLDVDEPFGVNGRWWRVRQDVDKLTLVISPSIGATNTLYLETSRPMQPLYTDASAAPPIAAEDLVAALVYDEVLAYLSRPGRGAADERATWRKARAAHADELHRLLVRYRPKPKRGPPQLEFPAVVPQPWSAR